MIFLDFFNKLLSTEKCVGRKKPTFTVQGYRKNVYSLRVVCTYFYLHTKLLHNRICRSRKANEISLLFANVGTPLTYPSIFTLFFSLHSGTRGWSARSGVRSRATKYSGLFQYHRLTAKLFRSWEPNAARHLDN